MTGVTPVDDGGDTVPATRPTDGVRPTDRACRVAQSSSPVGTTTRKASDLRSITTVAG